MRRRAIVIFFTAQKLELNATDLKDRREVETAYKKGHELIWREYRRTGLSYPWYVEIMEGLLVKVKAKLSHYRLNMKSTKYVPCELIFW